MNSILNFTKRNAGKILMFLLLLGIPVSLAIFTNWSYVFYWFALLICIYLVSVFYRAYPVPGRKWLYTKKGYFKQYDIVYDRGSATRPVEAGVLKYSEDEQIWFIVYLDGFEWPMSDPKNLELFTHKK